MLQLAMYLLLAQVVAQQIPQQLWGKWAVKRLIPTTTISCWGNEDAKIVVGTEIEYSAKTFRWKDVVTNNATAKVKTITADEFYRENSGSGSRVSFQQLGIPAKETVEISIQHPPAEIIRGTVEIPGDSVLIKDKNTIVFPACGLYFEAERVKALR